MYFISFYMSDMSDNMTTTPSQMTLELERIIARGRHIHPTMPENWSGHMHRYDGTMDWILPHLDDKPGILRFIGLNDIMIVWVLERYQEEYGQDEYEPDTGEDADAEPLAAKPINTNNRDKRILEGHGFPLLNRLWDIVLERDIEYASDLEDDYEGFVRGGLREGLRPEFAIFVGLHPSENCYSLETAREHYLCEGGYQEQADGVMKRWVGTLATLWSQRIRKTGDTGVENVEFDSITPYIHVPVRRAEVEPVEPVVKVQIRTQRAHIHPKYM
ncbi:hypothetical protein F4808DRAFT_463525 [Astrocystis sublimbata]|nr:hypothetical protein F4808DRAFT_463525 [Astrocystis sublimbata]